MPTYSQQGPFTNGSSALTATIMNNIESFLLAIDDANISAPGSGQWNCLKIQLTLGTIKRINRFSSTGTGASQTLNHGLGEQPDIILFNYAGNFGSPPDHPVYYWNENGTQVNVKADNGYFYYGLAIKF
jgi:hypothetical protein